MTSGVASGRVARGALVFAAAFAAAALLSPAWGQQVSERPLGYSKGSPSATLVVVEFADFGCSACAEFARSSFAALDSVHVRSGRVRWVLVPFVLGAFRHSREAASAAECADRQGALWSMHDTLFARRGEWMGARNPRAALSRYAAFVGIDTGAFVTCLDSPETRAVVAQHQAAAKQRGVRATPTFFVGERRVLGALPAPLFSALLAEITGRSD